MKLTKSIVAALKPKARSYRVYDGAVGGLCVTVGATGGKTWGVRYGSRSARRFATLGKVDVLTVEQARDAAKKMLAAATLGGDPVEAKRQDSRRPTFSSWLETHVSRISKTRKAWRETERYLRIAEARWGKRRIDSITTEDVLQLLDTVPKEHAATRNRMAAAIGTCFTRALESRLVKTHPALKIKKAQESPPRDRVLIDDERTRLVEAFDAEQDPHARAALFLLLATGCRLSEALGAKWTDMDLQAAAPAWRIPSPKSGRPESVSLMAGLVEILRALPKTSVYVIAGVEPRGAESGKGRRYDLRGPWRRALQRARLEDAGIHVHDLRRDMGRRLYKQHGLIVASRVLRHRDVRVTSMVYARETGADLAAAVETQAGVVLPLPRKAE